VELAGKVVEIVKVRFRTLTLTAITTGATTVAGAGSAAAAAGGAGGAGGVGSTVNKPDGPLEAPVPPLLVTEIVPLVAPPGTTAVIWVAELTT
jgi:hypothetical protein